MTRIRSLVSLPEREEHAELLLALNYGKRSRSSEATQATLLQSMRRARCTLIGRVKRAHRGRGRA